MATVLIGTSGYDYLEWRELFYPRDLPREEFLAFYALSFPTVELNFSYYRMPAAGGMAAMLRRAGETLDFSVKAHRSLTHDIDPACWKERAAEYRRALKPLAQAGRLGAVLFQFPSSFHYEPDRRKYLDALLRELADLPAVVEFRNPAWQNTRVYDALRSRGTGICVTDMPDLRGLPQSADVATSDRGYIRFHGRNGRAWWGSDAAERYNYLYTPEELEGWERRIRCLRAQVRSLRIYFNNHRAAQAARNAKMLQKLVEEREDGAGPGG